MNKKYSYALMEWARRGISYKTLIEFVSTLIKSLKSNAFFPDASKYLEPLIKKFNDFVDAVAAAKNGTSSDKQKAKNLKKEVQDLIRPLCSYINMTADGDRVMLLTSGFNLNKVTDTPVELNPIEALTAVNGKVTGDMKISFEKQPGTSGVNFQWTQDATPGADSNWKTVSGNRKSITISGFMPGTQVSFRINALGPNGQSVFSPIVTKTVNFNP